MAAAEEGLSHSKDGVSSAANVAAASSFMSRRVSDQSKRSTSCLRCSGEDDFVTTAALSWTRYLRATWAVVLLCAFASFVVSGPDRMSDEPWPPEPIGE